LIIIRGKVAIVGQNGAGKTTLRGISTVAATHLGSVIGIGYTRLFGKLFWRGYVFRT
jgi:ABC-type molybdenum transport system ATPase subunit/photorepair protein PhrA